MLGQSSLSHIMRTTEELEWCGRAILARRTGVQRVHVSCIQQKRWGMREKNNLYGVLKAIIPVT